MSFIVLDKIYKLLKDKKYDEVKNNYKREDIDCVLRLRNFEMNIEEIKFELKKCRDKQSIFREKLIKKFKKCPITNNHYDFCEAAHIIPYSDCKNEEKYDINNGILLSAELHKSFDKYYFTIDENTCKIKLNYNLIETNNLPDFDKNKLLNIENLYIKELDNNKTKYYLKIHNNNCKF